MIYFKIFAVFTICLARRGFCPMRYTNLFEGANQSTTRVSAALKNYAALKGTSARKLYILMPLQLQVVHRKKIDQSKKKHIQICQDPRCIKKIYFLHMHVALSLKCNKCSSKVSWVDCEDEQFTYPTDMADHCVTSYVKNSDEQTFSKYCGSKKYCEYSSKAMCKAAENIGASECKVTCCTGELCNAGFAAAKISGVVMLTCVFTLLVFPNL